MGKWRGKGCGSRRARIGCSAPPSTSTTATIAKRLPPPAATRWSSAPGVERLATAGGGPAVLRPRLDAREYVAAGGQAVLAARLFFEGASAPLLSYERALLGGSLAAGGPLRGWPAGVAVGDQIAAASIELRLPITSVLWEGRFGLRIFYDTRRRIRYGEARRAGAVPGGCRCQCLFYAAPIRSSGFHRRGARFRRRSADARQRRLRILKAIDVRRSKGPPSASVVDFDARTVGAGRSLIRFRDGRLNEGRPDRQA